VIVEGTRLDTTHYTAQYELLRSQVLAAGWDGARVSPAGIGLALLLSQGMPAWLKTVEGVLRTSLAPRALECSDISPHESSTGYSAAPVWLSNVQRQEVTALLASLVLSTRRSANP